MIGTMKRAAVVVTLATAACATLPEAQSNTAAAIPLASRAAEPVVNPFGGEQPNVLWIITDDQRADSIAAFNKATRGTSQSALGYVESPAIDALAAEGVMFTHAYNQNPGCAPSRYSMHRGMYSHRSGVYGFEYNHDATDLWTPMVPEAMANAGYQTMLVGKRGIRLRKFTGGLQAVYEQELERNQIARAGLTDFWVENVNRDGAVVESNELWTMADGTVRSHPRIRDGEKIDEANPIDAELGVVRSYTRRNQELILAGMSPREGHDTLDGYIRRAFTEYLGNADTRYESLIGRKYDGPKTDQPLFLTLSFHFPHTPVIPPKEWRDRFMEHEYTLPEFDAEELAGMPPQLRRIHEIMQTSDMTDEEKHSAIRDYYAFTAFGDSLIGEAVEQWKAYNTALGKPWVIIMTVGDHGWHLGEQGIEAKFAPWNSSNQGTIIAVDSEGALFPRGTVHSDFVEYVDIYPTILARSGVNPADEAPYLSGLDLARVIREPELHRDYVLTAQNQINGEWGALRTKRYMLSLRLREGWSKPGGRQFDIGEGVTWAAEVAAEDADLALYDLACDPNERVNLASDPRYADVLGALRKKATDIFLGDNRVEVDWTKENRFYISDFAEGAHDRRLPPELADVAACPY